MTTSWHGPDRALLAATTPAHPPHRHLSHNRPVISTPRRKFAGRVSSHSRRRPVQQWVSRVGREPARASGAISARAAADAIPDGDTL